MATRARTVAVFVQRGGTTSVSPSANPARISTRPSCISPICTPPMLAVSDAAVVGRSVGTSLLVARFGLNTAKEVSLSMQRLEQAGVNIKGAILNGVIKRASTAYSYGYNYYGYSYSEKE